MPVEHASSQDEPVRDLAVCDLATLAGLAEAFGRARMLDLLAGLEREVAHRLDPDAADPATIVRDAHALASMSGSLGFVGLSRACAELERICLTGGDATASLRHARNAARRAQQVIAEIRAASA